MDLWATRGETRYRVYRSYSFQVNCSYVQFKIMSARWQESARSHRILKICSNIEEDYIVGKNENDLNACIYILDLT